MVAAIKQTVTVGPGGIIEVCSPQLQPGVRAEVIILFESTTQAEVSAESPRPLASFIGAAQGSFTSIEDVDNFVRNERDGRDR
jgi:hypothetical protein